MFRFVIKKLITSARTSKLVREPERITGLVYVVGVKMDF